MDFSLQELANHLGGSVVTAGPDRLTGAGRSGTPQIVAPGAVDMVDFPAWQPVPAVLKGRAVHVHNRLIASATSAPPLRARIAREIGARLAEATGPTCLLLPLRGVEQWDRPGEPLHDPEGLQAFTAAMRARCRAHALHSSWTRTSTTPPSPTPRCGVRRLGGAGLVPPGAARA
jgi:uncharacterized protein (UPF0261 family)